MVKIVCVFIKQSFNGSANLRFTLTYVKVETLILKCIFKNNIKKNVLLQGLLHGSSPLPGSDYVIIASFNFIIIICRPLISSDGSQTEPNVIYLAPHFQISEYTYCLSYILIVLKNSVLLKRRSSGGPEIVGYIFYINIFISDKKDFFYLFFIFFDSSKKIKYR